LLKDQLEKFYAQKREGGDFEGKHFSGLVWRISGSYSGSQIIGQAKDEISPVIASLPGFQETAGVNIYYSAAVPYPVTYFFNVFDNAEQAAVASAKTLSIVQNGALAGDIFPATPIEGIIVDFRVKRGVSRLDATNKAVDFTTAVLQPNATLTPSEILTQFRVGLVPQLIKTPGFYSYTAVIAEYATILLQATFENDATSLADAQNVFNTFVGESGLLSQVFFTAQYRGIFSYDKSVKPEKVEKEEKPYHQGGKHDYHHNNNDEDEHEDYDNDYSTYKKKNN